jgi:two-component system response regulator (stage 0 sporulation protein F)
MAAVSRILVVDDEPIIRMLLVESLADAGYIVTGARNGAEALDRALESHSDIVLLDLLMPGADGFTFLRERQSHPDLSKIPVVVLSAAGIDYLRQASQLRATAVLSKPVDLDVLATVVEHVLREWRREPVPEETTGRLIGKCPVCGEFVHKGILDDGSAADRLQAMHQARLGHVLSHVAGDIAAVPLRKRLLQLPLEGRGALAKWLYYDLRRDWGDLDRRGVHSMESVLGSAKMHGLWHEAEQCGWPGCRHQPAI